MKFSVVSIFLSHYYRYWTAESSDPVWIITRTISSWLIDWLIDFITNSNIEIILQDFCVPGRDKESYAYITKKLSSIDAVLLKIWRSAEKKLICLKCEPTDTKSLFHLENFCKLYFLCGKKFLECYDYLVMSNFGSRLQAWVMLNSPPTWHIFHHDVCQLWNYESWLWYLAALILWW